MSAEHCSDFAPRVGGLKVLIVGAERSDEFADAARLSGRGYYVIVVNPKESLAGHRFANAGGIFIRSGIERLSSALGLFDQICENYPYTIARACWNDPCPVWFSARLMRAYAMARLQRLAPNGRWILFTESPGFAAALSSIGRRDQTISPNFSVRIVRLINGEAPQSSYPRLATRFKVIFQRHLVEPFRTRSAAARKAYL
jgi:hypothetical protein